MLPARSHGGPAPAAPAPFRVQVGPWAVAAGGTLVLWSLTYLARQAPPAGGVVASPLGDFALEGVALALAWLGAVLTACATCLGASDALAPGARGAARAVTGAGGRHLRPAGGRG
jgi:hypothetical protein